MGIPGKSDFIVTSRRPKKFFKPMEGQGTSIDDAGKKIYAWLDDDDLRYRKIFVSNKPRGRTMALLANEREQDRCNVNTNGIFWFYDKGERIRNCRSGIVGKSKAKGKDLDAPFEAKEKDRSKALNGLLEMEYLDAMLWIEQEEEDWKEQEKERIRIAEIQEENEKARALRAKERAAKAEEEEAEKAAEDARLLEEELKRIQIEKLAEEQRIEKERKAAEERAKEEADLAKKEKLEAEAQRLREEEEKR